VHLLDGETVNRMVGPHYYAEQQKSFSWTSEPVHVGMDRIWEIERTG
jgi:hypothetical protein